MPCHMLINRVIQNFPNKVVKTLFTSVSNIHGRTGSYCFLTLQNLD